MTRTIAIDWSGARTGERSKIWLAEIRDGVMVRLESGRNREEVIDHVIAEAGEGGNLIVGLDFGFSFPEWFVRGTAGAESIEQLWAAVAREGEEWLSSCSRPFWGRPGKPRPELPADFRRTEQAAAGRGGSQPKSVFQIGGAGAVGTGSLRGMPHLLRLRDAGFSVWPFHAPTERLVVEIYPRLLTGPVTKSSQDGRESYLRNQFPEIPSHLEPVAASSEDAFDAAVSAVVMARNADALASLEQSDDAVELLEGRIWWPSLGVVEPEEVRSPVDVATDVHADCPLCDPPRDRLVLESEHAFALPDAHPVSRGHTLVVSRRHVGGIFDLGAKEQSDLWQLVARVRSKLLAEHRPAGFNVGLNDGEAAGQTVGHAHVHIIPRNDGDVDDPRGGVRWVLPERAAYWRD